MSLNTHWTEESPKRYAFRIAADFVRFIEETMDAAPTPIKQSDLAAALGVTEGSVSQSLNNPGNMTLQKIVAYARAVKRKVAIVGYDDGDPENVNGPVNAGVFAQCWEMCDRPRDFFDLSPAGAAQVYVSIGTAQLMLNVTIQDQAGTSSQYGFSRRPTHVGTPGLRRD